MTSPTPVASSSDITSTRPRPKRSERMEAGTIMSAIAPVVAEMVRAATVGVMWKTLVKVGSSAWVQYSPLKVARPTASMARVARR